MDRTEFKSKIGGHPSVKELKSLLKKKGCGEIRCQGLTGSFIPLVFQAALENADRDAVIVMNDREEAAYFYDDLNRLEYKGKLHFFPSSYKRSFDYDRVDPENIILRTDVLSCLANKKEPSVVITYPEAISERVISDKSLSTHTLEVKKGDELSIQYVNEILNEYGFEREDFVYEPGQYSIRGSIVDIFSFSNEDPYRVDFFGDEIESIRTFDIETQISKEKYDNITIIPNIQEGLQNEDRIPFFEFLPKYTLLAFRDLDFVSGSIENLFKKAIDAHEQKSEEELEGKIDPLKALIGKEEFESSKVSFPLLEFGNRSNLDTNQIVVFNTSPQPIFNKNFELLAEDLTKNFEKSYTPFILSSSTKQFERLHAIFKDKGEHVEFEELNVALNEGFIDHDLKICCYTDHQIFERYHRYKLRSKKSSKSAITLKELSKLHPGDYVVHIDHGVGKFAGLVRSNENGKVQESLRLVFKGNDSLLVSIHSLHRISKYKGKDGTEPKVNKLGTPAWQNLKNKTKKKVKDIAKDLIALYAKRKEQKGFEFSLDTYLQQELEASFIYEDTPDQEKATLAVKEDMQKDIPMDRLVCGDVGFGKTEVAIRAAFKAVADSKQVAVLVPTTILAFQHYKTFKERLKDLPCNIGYVSRLRKPKEIKQTLNDLKEGKIDIVIGTHRLVGKDVMFKDLGLLIIDEEQKFGVSVKEKLKQFKVNVDTLTLTATPIPRTLQFSLMGARDLSIINTPPPNRYPIVTEVHGFNEAIIKEAINYELDRNGQAFFIHNRVGNILEVEAMINRICPGVRTVVGHGQMDGAALEKVMLDFMAGEYDVLIATTIIESGLDVPNANTIIINQAQNFGLSETHQLRGRVGRSNKKAFCYLLAPPMENLSTESRQRLQAIEEFSDLGSGFNISMQDLNIRGAGNMLGGEQSGFIADIGFETYQRILSEAVLELKQEEFQGLFDEKQDQEANKAFMKFSFVADCQIDTDIELRFPEDYISNTPERMLLYRELDNIDSAEEMETFKKNLIDRFGPIPKVAQELMEVVPLRWLAKHLGMEKIVMKKNRMFCHFVSDPESKFYESPQFGNIMTWIQKQERGTTGVQEKKDHMVLTMIKIDEIAKGRQKLMEMKI